MKAREVMNLLNIGNVALHYLIKSHLIKVIIIPGMKYDYNDKSVNLLKKIQNINSKDLTK